MLNIVDDEEPAPFPKEGDEPLQQRTPAHLAQPQRLGNGSNEETRIADRIERNEGDAVRERSEEIGTDPQGEAGLADSTGTGQRHQTDIIAKQEVDDPAHLDLTA